MPEKQVMLPRYQKSNPRVGDRVCTKIELPEGRWVPGTKIQRGFFYESPPVDVVADRLAKRNGKQWSNPRLNVGTVVGASANRRDLVVKLDNTNQLVKLHSKECIDAGNVERALANAQVQVMIETIKKEDHRLEKYVKEQLENNQGVMTQTEIQKKFGNTLPLASMYEEDARARKHAEHMYKLQLEIERMKLAEQIAQLEAQQVEESLVTAEEVDKQEQDSTTETQPHTELVIKGVDGEELTIQVPFKVVEAMKVDGTSTNINEEEYVSTGGNVAATKKATFHTVKTLRNGATPILHAKTTRTRAYTPSLLNSANLPAQPLPVVREPTPIVGRRAATPAPMNATLPNHNLNQNPNNTLQVPRKLTPILTQSITSQIYQQEPKTTIRITADDMGKNGLVIKRSKTPILKTNSNPVQNSGRKRAETPLWMAL